MILIIKPTLHCNLRCKYCYLSNASKQSSQQMMSIEFAKRLLEQARDVFLKKNTKKPLKILWHGGEPLLWGENNYKEIFSYISTLFNGYNYKISIQTNLTLVNSTYISLFKKYKVHIGVSLDGPKFLHDNLRISGNGDGTFDIVMQNIKRLRKEKIKVGCICVLSKNHINHIKDLYDFMCANNLGHKANPLFRAGESIKIINDIGITPNEYAKMTIELFDLWFYDKKNKNNNATFSEMASNLLTGQTSLCVFNSNCQNSIICISPSGDVVPCGRFCDEKLINKFTYGNLFVEDLATIVNRRRESDAYKRTLRIEMQSCKKCYLFSICHGGCLHDGYNVAGDFNKKTFLCNAYKKIYQHIAKRLHEIGLESVINFPIANN